MNTLSLITFNDSLITAGVKTLKQGQMTAAVLYKDRIRCRDLAKLMQISKENCLATAKWLEKKNLLRIEVTKDESGKRAAWVVPTPYLRDIYSVD